jgi:hypothetical protein
MMAEDHPHQLDRADEQVIAAFPPSVRGFLRWIERPSLR